MNHISGLQVELRPRWSPEIFACYQKERDSPQTCNIGVLRGEGIGPEVVDAALTVLTAVESASESVFHLRFGSSIGVAAEQRGGKPLTEEVIAFCEDTFARGGALLSGPGGGRYVYDLRRHFNLFCKLNPLITCRELSRVGRIRKEYTKDVDIMVVRENVGGIYQGHWTLDRREDGTRCAAQRFEYSEETINRILNVAAKVARHRAGKLAVVTKPNGVPSISELWLACAADVAKQYGVEMTPLEVDYAAYQIIQEAQQLDVVVTSNLFGDILADLGGVLLGSRGLCYSASYSDSGCAVYQTNHGAAHDLTGTDRANPVGQIHSLAMMLHESFGLSREAALIDHAVRRVWREGFRTPDLAEGNSRVCGTREMADRIAKTVHDLATVYS